MKRTWGLAAIALVISLATASPQITYLTGRQASGGAPLTLELSPHMSMPLSTDTSLFGYGGGASLTALWQLPFFPAAFLGPGIGYSYMSTPVSGLSLSALDFDAEAGLSFQFSRRLAARLWGKGGYFGAQLNSGGDGAEYNPWFGAGGDLAFAINSSLAVGLGAEYRDHYGLVNDLAFRLGLSYRLVAGASGRPALPPGFTPLSNSGKGLAFSAVKLDSVFPVFYKHYDDHPIGTIIVRNFEAVAARDIKATVNVKRYMDEAKDAEVPVLVRPGAAGQITLYGLFSDSILDVVEATKLPVSVKLEYSQYGKTYSDEYVGTLDVLDRNAITWDDDRKAAAFISARDPEVIKLAKGVAVATKDFVNPVINQNLQLAMAVHETLRVSQMAYVKDPASALETSNKQVVDYILFPQQTLGYNSGKCGDLTVLYCSLLESVGVPTALITVPGHILMAVDLEMSPAEAEHTFSRSSDLIIRDGHVWLPIETTERAKGFEVAWEEGAAQWRDGTAKKVAAFYPVHDAWKEYQPVVYAGDPVKVPKYDLTAASRAFRGELARYVESELGPRVAALQLGIRKSPGDVKQINALGVLYARFGQLDKASEQFSVALAKKTTEPALINMGNILFLRGSYAEALGNYTKALRMTPDDPKLLLAVSRTNAALGKYVELSVSFGKLKSIDPALASQYSYLDGTASGSLRAADIEASKGGMLWQD
ncbi:MAG TPA: hypothetical protein VMC79_07220 [Rectinemataceae bacterium]|nr:hypothetical protein [Rectinemataceae bacterium]